MQTCARHWRCKDEQETISAFKELISAGLQISTLLEASTECCGVGREREQIVPHWGRRGGFSLSLKGGQQVTRCRKQRRVFQKGGSASAKWGLWDGEGCLGWWWERRLGTQVGEKPGCQLSSDHFTLKTMGAFVSRRAIRVSLLLIQQVGQFTDPDKNYT